MNLDNNTKQLVIKRAIAKGYSHIEATIYVERMQYIADKFGYTMAYEQFLVPLMD